MKEIFKIAIDGPSGAGKSTIAKAVARRLGIDYIDTGAMYRAIGLKMTRLGLAMEENGELQSMLDETDIDFHAGDVILDGVIVNDLIRTPEMSMAASACSALGMVRAKLVELQRGMGQKKSVIMDGRDICSVVLPDAEYKYYLTASAEERARRRTAELMEKGQKVDFAQVLADIQQRDYNDMNRAITPLKKAEDAVEIDSTDMSIEEVVEFICAPVEAEG
ncbi:MAG: (d)CMP kinase [Firmicutes bacterium]|nr:(d)CMP kinase [Bacillota bacterium]